MFLFVSSPHFHWSGKRVKKERALTQCKQGTVLQEKGAELVPSARAFPVQRWGFGGQGEATVVGVREYWPALCIICEFLNCVGVFMRRVTILCVFGSSFANVFLYLFVCVCVQTLKCFLWCFSVKTSVCVCVFVSEYVQGHMGVIILSKILPF